MLKTKKGFSLLEVIITMCIISTLTILAVANTSSLNLDHYHFLNDYLYKQSLAIKNRENVDVTGGVYFNNMGHVNQARTLEFTNHSIIIHLGSGYATIE